MRIGRPIDTDNDTRNTVPSTVNDEHRARCATHDLTRDATQAKTRRHSRGPRSKHNHVGSDLPSSTQDCVGRPFIFDDDSRVRPVASKDALGMASRPLTRAIEGIDDILRPLKRSQPAFRHDPVDARASRPGERCRLGNGSIRFG